MKFFNAQYLDEDGNPIKIPKWRVQWHVTERCNLNCIHCYQDPELKSDEMSLDQIKKGIDMLDKTVKKWGISCEVSVTGGEPLLREDLFEIFDYISSKGMNISLLTNGTLLDKNSIKKLKSYHNLKYVQVSLDGGSKEIHEKVRGRDTFEKAIRAIELLDEMNIPSSTKFTIHRYNVNDLQNYLDLAVSKKVGFISIARLIPWGSGKKIKEMMLSKEEGKEAFLRVVKKMKESNSMFNTRRPLWCLLSKDDVQLGGSCVAGLSGVTILPNGDVVPCRPLEVRLGNIKKDTFFKIWYTNDFIWMMRNAKLKGRCSSCTNVNKCKGCRAIAYACTGDYLAEDPQCFKDV